MEVMLGIFQKCVKPILELFSKKDGNVITTKNIGNNNVNKVVINLNNKEDK